MNEACLTTSIYHTQDLIGGSPGDGLEPGG
jgi:hypothetical protein